MKLLIGYDGSECANAALDDLDRAGLPEVAEVVILCVADVFLPPSSGTTEEAHPTWLSASISQARAQVTEAVQQAHVTAEHARSRLQSDHESWRIHAEACADSPGWGIINKARQWQPDLVIVGPMGTPGPSAYSWAVFLKECFMTHRVQSESGALLRAHSALPCE